MRKNLTTYFLKAKKYFASSGEEKNLLLAIFLVGSFIVFLANWEIKNLLPAQPSYGGIYREGIYEEIESLNPVFPKNDTQKAILNIVYPPLIEFDNGRLISKFFKNYSISADALTYTLQLKDNLRWSDGSPLTAEDVLFGLKMLQKEGPVENSNFFKDVEAEIVDSQKIVFHLKTNDNYFLFNLKYLRPLPQKFFLSNSFQSSLDYLKIGSGPFVLETWFKSGEISYLILKRNQFYQPQPYLDKVIFYLYPSAKRAFEGLFLKEIDGLAGLNYFNLPNNIFFNYRVYKIVLPRVIGLFFNSQKISPEEVNFLEKNIDRDWLIKNIFHGYAEKSWGIFSPSLRKILSIEDLNLNEFQFNKTKKPSTIVLITPSSYFYPEIARYFRDNLNFELEIVSSDVFNEKIKNKDYQAILTGINFSHPPALFAFFSLAGFNLNNTTNLDLEKNFQKIISDPKINWSQELYESEKKIIALRNNLFLVNPNYLYFLQKNIHGFDQTYLWEPAARFVKIEYWFKR